MSTRSTGEAKAFPHVPAYQPQANVKGAMSSDFIARMAANDVASATQRREIYHLVHKGLRAAMGEALVRLGRVDSVSPDSVEGALGTVENLLTMCREHLEHENECLHTAMEAVVPGSSRRCADDHAHHEKAIAGLAERVAEARKAAPAARERALKVIYRLLAIFVAENIEHMEIEESANTETLWQHYSDDEILAIEHKIHARIKPERMMAWLRWILPNVSRQQRAVMMKGMQAGMPPELFGNILEMVKPHLTEAERLALATDLA